MTIGTPIKQSNSLFFGTAKVFVADSETHIEETGLICDNSHYIGSMTNVEITVSKKFRNSYTFQDGIQVLQDVTEIQKDYEISLSTIELTTSNLSMLINSPTPLRMEVVSAFPDKTTFFKAIFPRVKCNTESSKLSLIQTENPMDIPIKFAALITTNPLWAANPYGKILVG